MAKEVRIENTHFIYATNFEGDPKKDNYGSSDRKANIIIPTKEQADDLASVGFNVKVTKPKEGEEEGFVPIYFISAKANYDSEWPPKIYLVSGDAEPRLLDAQTVGMIDDIYVLNVNAILNPYWSERNKTWSLYIKIMYVEQDCNMGSRTDPFASVYRRG